MSHALVVKCPITVPRQFRQGFCKLSAVFLPAGRPQHASSLQNLGGETGGDTTSQAPAVWPNACRVAERWATREGCTAARDR